MECNCWCIFLTVHMLDQIRSTQSCLVWKSSFSNMITMIYDVFCWYIHGKTCDRQHWTSKTVSLGVKQINCLKCLESAWWIKDRNGTHVLNVIFVVGTSLLFLVLVTSLHPPTEPFTMCLADFFPADIVVIFERTMHRVYMNQNPWILGISHGYPPGN